jgi:hypothetical protein
MAKTRKQRTQKLTITGHRRGEVRFATAYTALEAARAATKLTHQGYKVQVTATHSGHVKMTCEPQLHKHAKFFAGCKINPAFKKQIKGLAGL